MTNQQEAVRDEFEDALDEYADACVDAYEARTVRATIEKRIRDEKRAKVVSMHQAATALAEARYRDVLEASQHLNRTMLRYGCCFDEPVKLARLRLSEALDVALAAPLLGRA